MLSRSLARSLSKTPSPRICKTCICSCGARFARRSIAPPQKRTKTTLDNAHPAVYRKKTKGRRALTAQERNERRLQDKSDYDWHLDSIERAEQSGVISTSGQTIIDFLNDFADLCKASGYKRSGASPVDNDKLRDIIGDIEERDCVWAAYCLLRSPSADHQVYGKKLMYALSHLGSEIATLHIMRQVLLEAKQKPTKLNATEIQHMRKHLKRIADQGKNFRAMVLEGKVQYALGNQKAAIPLWTDAMEAAVAHADSVAEEKAAKSKPGGPEASALDHAELETPWIELAAIHFKRQEWAKLRWAVQVGCEMDDPTSHYYAASLHKQTDDSGGTIITSAWLYHMTKAAASGHAKAAHELGYFYGNSVWPFLEDEPPDHVKPTPFDTYPAEDGVNSKAGAGFKDTVRQLFGLQTKPREQPQETVFKTAIFPEDPRGRMSMALEWLKIANAYTYAPARLLTARLRLEKTLWATASTPKAAINMTDDRYTYASKADFEAGKPIEGKTESIQAETAAEELPNPFYDPKEAYASVREVFYAHIAQRARARTLAFWTGQRKRGHRIDDRDIEELFLTEEGIGKDGREVIPEAKVFLRFPEVREMYSEDDKGILVDDTGSEPEDIVEAACMICEEQGWDVYDARGALMYRHGMARGTGQAATAPGSRR